MTVKQVIRELISNSSNVSSIAELERKLTISNGTINKWDNVKPSIEALSKVADYFDVSIDYLLERTDNPYPKREDEDLQDLVMMFRKNEEEIPEEKREEFRKDIEKYMKFVRNELNDN